MKQFISVILLLLLALQTFYAQAITLCYYANKNYIAAELCENKETPQLHCNGKCFLKKQLKKAEAGDHKDKASLKVIEAFVYIAHPVVPGCAPVYHTSKNAYPAFEPDHYAFHYRTSPFRPPCI